MKTLSKPTLSTQSKSAAALSFAAAFTEPDANQAKPALARLNANIPVELHRALKVRAASEGVSIGDLVEAWIKSWAGK